ncbi:MAG: hypothetical protein UU63_C0063G0003 [Candidatus Uhrbacteria bacterium GW2011_GWF2_41_430]|nr:MAG: hypothetical protein UU63_C0063G0003 [Candidatus Uhrbacteria bacterium GW2011_GWF2_41_430]
MKKPVIISIIVIALVIVVAGFLLMHTSYRSGYVLNLKMMNGNIEPLASYQYIQDESYLDATITPRYDWDINRVPSEVKDWELQGYSCYPMPGKFDENLAVTSVLWECEIAFANFSYLDPSQTDIQETFESARYTCGLVPCTKFDGVRGKLILCTLK